MTRSSSPSSSSPPPPPPPTTPEITSSEPLILSGYNSALSEFQSAYDPLREAIVQTATDQGFDPLTMIISPMNWATDVDGNGHVKAATLQSTTPHANFKLIESFSRSLGVEMEREMVAGRGRVATLAKRSDMVFRRQVYFPDVLLTALRFVDVRPDGYTTDHATWSLRQQVIVTLGESEGVFVDTTTKKAADLTQLGGPYLDLYADLCRRMEDGKRRRKRAQEENQRLEKMKEKVVAEPKL